MFPTTWYGFQLPFFKILIFFPISVSFPSFPFNILHNSLNIKGRWYSFPFSHVIFFPTAMIWPSSLHNLIYFPYRLDKLPGGGVRNFIHSWSIDRLRHTFKTTKRKTIFRRETAAGRVNICSINLPIPRGKFIKYVGIEYQIWEGGREYQGCGEEYNVERRRNILFSLILRLLIKR